MVTLCALLHVRIGDECVPAVLHYSTLVIRALSIRVQEAMGYKAGSGLGSRSQGMSAPVSDLLVERSGRGGLGFRDVGIERFLSDLPQTWDYSSDPVRLRRLFFM